MKQLIMLRGLPASGKSTWAKAVVESHPNQYKRVNKDEIRDMIDNGFWSRDTEKFVLRVRDSIIAAALDNGKHVIVDDTNFAPKHEAHLKQMAKAHDAEFVVRNFEASVEDCIERDLKRSRSVGERVIRKMYNDYLRPAVEKIEPDYSLPWCIICDLDGTLAHLNGRNPYDASTCEQDELCLPVFSVIHAVHANCGDDIIFMSGREDKYREQTERWLMGHYAITPLHIYMRSAGDMRKDSIIKRELYEAHVKGKYNVRFVLDDRNQVVELWRSLGLTCFQVAEGDF